MEYTFDNVIKRVHIEWFDFFDSNKDDFKNILDQVNKDVVIFNTYFFFFHLRLQSKIKTLL